MAQLQNDPKWPILTTFVQLNTKLIIPGGQTYRGWGGGGGGRGGGGGGGVANFRGGQMSGGKASGGPSPVPQISNAIK